MGKKLFSNCCILKNQTKIKIHFKANIDIFALIKFRKIFVADITM